MKFKIHKNQIIGTLCYDYFDMVEYSLEYENSHHFRNIEQRMDFLTKENGLACSYYYDFINNSFIIKLYGSITNMLRFRSYMKYTFGFKEKNE